MEFVLIHEYLHILLRVLHDKVFMRCNNLFFGVVLLLDVYLVE